MDNLVTLTSLAMLKVNEDAERRDYIEYLKPFVLTVLSEQDAEQVSDSAVADALREKFGLSIPDRAVHLVLRRLVRKGTLKKEHGAFYVTAKVEPPDLTSRKTEAKRHIEEIAQALVTFSQNTPAPLPDAVTALETLITFLSEFSIDCLRSYVFHTALPKTPRRQGGAIVLVSKFVREISEKDPKLWDSFVVLAKGHMLANSLICPDLESLQQTFRKTTFYLDTPFVVRLLGLEGKERQRAAEQTTALVKNLSGRVAIFEHTVTESYRVIIGAAQHIDSQDGRGAIVFEMRKQGMTFTDLVLIAERLDLLLDQKGIKHRPTPKYVPDLQIGEIAFENVLDEEISYYNDKAREFDVNSVRSIYVLRQGTCPHRLEDARAVLVTSNAAFAKAAFIYGRDFESTREVSSVITDFGLANISWLKSPLHAADLPKAESLSLSYAALNPSEKLWNKYLQEIDKLKDNGEIAPRDHAFLRYGPAVRQELMDLTLGEEDALTKQTVTQILEKAVAEHSHEMHEKLSAEKLAHDRTMDDLRREIGERARLEKRLAFMATSIANAIASIIFAVCACLVLVVVYLTSLGLGFVVPTILVVFLAALTAANLIWGVTLRKVYSRIRDVIRSFVLSHLFNRT
jgi:predicted transcriptional regulator